MSGSISNALSPTLGQQRKEEMNDDAIRSFPRFIPRSSGDRASRDRGVVISPANVLNSEFPPWLVVLFLHLRPYLALQAICDFAGDSYVAARYRLVVERAGKRLVPCRVFLEVHTAVSEKAPN